MFTVRSKKRKRIWLGVILVLGIGIMLNSFSWFVKLLYPVHYENIVKKYASEYDLDPYLIFSIIKVESKFYEKAQSPKNARGLMQISPITGQWASKELEISGYTEDLLFIPNVNIRIGCWYLDKLRKEFRGDWNLILAAYNGGSGNVAKWLRDPEYSCDGKTLKKIPFSETKAYIEKVEKNYKIYKMIYK